MKKSQNLVKLALEAEEYEDEELVAVREAKNVERQRRFIGVDGTCLAHDRAPCKQCRRNAEGRGHPDEWL